MGMEMTYYEVMEDAGVVRLCINVSHPHIICPIRFPFEVQLSTTDGTAGGF